MKLTIEQYDINDKLFALCPPVCGSFYKLAAKAEKMMAKENLRGARDLLKEVGLRSPLPSRGCREPVESSVRQQILAQENPTVPGRVPWLFIWASRGKTTFFFRRVRVSLGLIFRT